MKSRKIKVIVVSIFMLCMLLLCQKISMAASASISASSTEVTVGTKVTIKVSGSAKAWSLKVNGAGISDKFHGGNISSKSNMPFSNSYNLNTSKPGTYTVSLSGDVTDADGTFSDISSSVTVRVNEKTTSSNNKNDDNTKNNDSKKSNNDTNKKNDDEKTDTTEPTFKSANDKVYATGDIKIRKS